MKEKRFSGCLHVVRQRRAVRSSKDSLPLGEESMASARELRSTRLGQKTDSIAKELNECLCGILINASTCLRMLSADPPNVEGARETARRTIRCSNRAAEAVLRLPPKTTIHEDMTG